mmetsp:Transcript_153477/g.490633  ORF Transcript_153477/g.490633 Transcript_153477/m.490633 type:complete len:143 (+) Transcript_153477:1533-1961(+)
MRDDMLVAFAGDQEFESADIFFCSEPVLFCAFFNDTSKATLGYFGVFIQGYLVPDDVPMFHRTLRALVELPRNTFLFSSAQLSQETHWYTGIRFGVITPTSLYTGSVGTWSPAGANARRILINNRLGGFQPDRVLNEFIGRY